jgi:shikimate kinase/3-dehydroquinate synthase
LVTPLENRHLVLVGFMGAGKSTVGAEVARRIGRAFIDVDPELERERGQTVAEIFEERGEEGFREAEEDITAETLEDPRPAVVSLGGGALASERVRESLRDHAVTVFLEVDVEEAWQRVRGTPRPLARDLASFRLLYEERLPVYRACADATAHDADDVVLAGGAIRVGTGSVEQLGESVPGHGPVALVTEPRVAGIHGADVQLALGSRLLSTHELPTGEDAKTVASVERLWRGLRLDRDGTVVAFGGGCVTDAAGFAAASYLRGVPWVSVPTTLVGQVDAGLGGKTALNLPAGKNLVGAFRWPVRTVIDPALLATLPDTERRAGMAEAVKTALLAGEPLWELPDAELVRRCASYKTAVCLRDPLDRGAREVLNLGHTFAHALEAGGAGQVAHGEAVALGLLAALRLSGLPTDEVERLLQPRPVRVDRERAWAALGRDKKRADGQTRLVLLEALGKPVTGVELPDEEVRAALDALIA